MAKYYTRITMKRMAGLLDLSVDVSSTLTQKTFLSKAQKNTEMSLGLLLLLFGFFLLEPIV